MNLALEIPKPHLEDLSKLTDVDFALAHMVLEDKEYAQFYAEQKKQNRRVFLDNGMFELGKPMNVAEILEAAKRIDPSTICAPDKLGDAAFGHEQFHLMRKSPLCRWDVALVLQGATYEERVSLFNSGRPYTQTLCLPFREPRTQWFTELINAIPKHVAWPMHLHLFGMSSLEDLTWFANQCEVLRWPSRCVTIDTAKPIKWAIAGKRLDELTELRGGGLLDHSKKLDAPQLSRTHFNIAYLRRFMR